jgi:Spy/CpxP family protein refolding chaperone
VIQSFHRRALVFAAAALVAALPVLAADTPASSPASHGALVSSTDWQAAAQAGFEEMKQDLKLTPEQEARIKPILAHNVQKLSALRDKYQGHTAGDPQKWEGMRKEMQTIRQQADEQLAKVLTPAQFDQWNKLRAEVRDKVQTLDREHKESTPAPAKAPASAKAPAK